MPTVRTCSAGGSTALCSMCQLHCTKRGPTPPTAHPSCPHLHSIAERGNGEGATPLHSAALGGCTRCAEALLGAGADAGLPDREGRLPADLAAPQVGFVGCRLQNEWAG